MQKHLKRRSCDLHQANAFHNHALTMPGLPFVFAYDCEILPEFYGQVSSLH